MHVRFTSFDAPWGARLSTDSAPTLAPAPTQQRPSIVVAQTPYFTVAAPSWDQDLPSLPRLSWEAPRRSTPGAGSRCALLPAPFGDFSCHMDWVIHQGIADKHTTSTLGHQNNYDGTVNLDNKDVR